MNISELLNLLNNYPLDSEIVKKMTSIFGPNVPEIACKIASSKLEDNFASENLRLLDPSEILEPDPMMIEKKLVPVADCMDNDFLVYRLEDNKWCLYNLYDECQFSLSDSLEELLKKFL